MARRSTQCEKSGHVMVDSHIRLPAASLYGQPPSGSISSLGPSSTPGVAGMSEDEFTPKWFNMLSTKAFCVISNVPNSQLRLKSQPVYQVSSPPRRFILGTLYICYGLRGRFYVFRETIRHAHAQLPFVFSRSRSSSHRGQCVLRRSGRTLHHTPRRRPRVRCRKQRVRDRRAQPILLLNRFSPQALTLARYCRGEPSPAAELVCCPP